MIYFLIQDLVVSYNDCRDLTLYKIVLILFLQIYLAQPLQIPTLAPVAQVRFSNDAFASYPQQISIGNNSLAVVYSRQPSYFAIHYQQPTKVEGAILELNNGAIAVFPGQPDSTQIQQIVSPVYTSQPEGSLAVPTGMIFIRFTEGVEVEQQREAIAQAGYKITQILAYAPHAAWLSAASGKIADALTGVSKLQAIPNVENVEPQMLMERSRR